MNLFNLIALSGVLSVGVVCYTPTYIDNVDVLIGGGSLSALAATMTLANLTSTMNIVLLEPTDWPGG